MQYALGEVGLRPDEFWSMTFTEIDAACIGYETREAKRKELDRLAISIMYNTNRKKGARAIQPQEVMPLFTDRRKKAAIMTQEEIEKMRELFNSVKWQNQN